jgi:PKD repeat protein
MLRHGACMGYASSALIALLAGCSRVEMQGEGAAGEGVVVTRQAVIFDDDDRMDVHEIASDPGLNVTQRGHANAIVQATALLVDESVISCGASTCTLSLDVPSFNGTPLCSDQIPGQDAVEPPDPSVEDGRRCSAFLVGPNVMVAHGACFERRDLGFPFDCADASVVFGWHTDGSGTASATVPVANVYSCQAIVSQANHTEAGGEPLIELPEFAVFTLDRAVTGRTPVTVRTSGTLAGSAELAVAGFPLALPMKVADDGAAVVNDHPNFFRATIDAETGQAGSPVFDINTGVVEGFVATVHLPRFDVRPPQGGDPECLEIRHCDTGAGCDAAEEGVGVQRITRVPLPEIPCTPSTCPGGTLADSDGDSFPDVWETGGVLSGAPIDLPGLGADPMHKDLFLHVDWMTRPAAGSLPAISFRPNDRVIDMLVDAFADAPLWNPDGEPGIRLHVDTGSGSSHEVEYTEFMGADTDAARALTQTSTYMGRPGGYEEQNRERVFHYLLMADTMEPDPEEDATLAPGFPGSVADTNFTIEITAIAGTELTLDLDARATYVGDRIFQGSTTTRVVQLINPEVCTLRNSSGCRVRVQSASGLSTGAALRDNGGRQDNTTGTTGGLPGRFFIVSIGAAEDENRHVVGTAGDDMFRAITIMHELGHNLGLEHGGNESMARKPNHVSVMSYLYNEIGIIGADGMAFIDYSRFELPSLNEASLDEALGIQHPQGAHVQWWCPGASRKLYTHEGAGAVMYDEFDRAVNWDCSAVTSFPPTQPPGEAPSSSAVNESINRLAGAQVMNGFDDWSNVDLASGGLIGNSEIDEIGPPPTEGPSDDDLNSFSTERFERPLPAFTVATTSTTALAPLTVTFNGNGSRDLQGSVTTYKWAFGDGAELVTVSPSVTHTYSQPGNYVATLIITDDEGNDSDYFVRERIAVKGLPVGCSSDGVAPVITAPNQTVSRCLPIPATATVTASATDASCPGNAHIELRARVVSVNGDPFTAEIVAQGGTISPILPPGVTVLEWTARDANGNTSTRLQTITVQVTDESSALCCATGQTISNGTALPDIRIFPFTGGYCVFGKGSFDTIATGPGADYISGGASGDYLTSSGASSTVSGGAGNDNISCSGGDARVYGGAGDDDIDVTGGGIVYGNAGNDTITALFGAHAIYPGPGRDFVEAGLFDDEVFIYDVCEVELFELIDGGLGGHDVLHSPVPIEELWARGAIIVGFEEVVVRDELRYLSECF